MSSECSRPFAARERLACHLPAGLARLFAAPEDVAPAGRSPRQAQAPAPAQDRTLAGFHGSGRSLSEGRAERAHQGSVARWHGSRDDRTLGGSQGEDDDEHLAGGRSGSRRPLSDGKR